MTTRAPTLFERLDTPFVNRAWDTLDGYLDRRATDRIDRRADARERDRQSRLFANERFRDATAREDLERDDENDLIRARLDDKRDQYRLQTSREDLERGSENERFRDTTTREDRLRDDELAAYREALDAADALRDDERQLLIDRGDLYREAFESRRGDTLISRALWPLALAAAAAGAVYLVRTT